MPRLSAARQARRARFVRPADARVAALAVSLSSTLGCGGGAPLLHEARTLGRGEVRLTGGVSANVPVGSAATALVAAKNDAAVNPGPSPGSDPTLAKGAVVLAAVTPGIAPFVAARVGIGARFEGGVTYTGHGARIDARRSFDFGSTSLSIGAGVDATFYGVNVSPQVAQIAQVDLSSLHGYGADIPVVYGWQSRSGLYMAWVGARAGWEHDQISTLTSEPRPLEPSDPTGLSATRFYGGALAGLAGGFRHVHVALEIDAAYQTISGAFNGNQVTVRGFSVTPAGGVWWTF